MLGKGEAVDELPKYQEVLARRIPPGTEEPDDPYDVRKGRITNPTVHIGLNQMQRVLNGLIGRYGKPEQIALELARELKLNEEQKADVNREIAKILTLPDMKERLVTLGCDAVASTPEEFDQMVKDSAQIWGEVIRASDIKLD